MFTRSRLAGMGVATALVGTLIGPVSAAVGARPAAKAAEVTVWLNAFIPSTVAGARVVTSGPHAGTTVFRGPFGGSCFATDQRSFSAGAGASARVHVEARFKFDPSSVTPARPRSTPTVEVDCDRGTERCVRAAVPSGGFVAGASTPSTTTLNLAMAASNPCVTGAPNVDVNGRLELVKTASTIRVSFTGNVEAFPSFEMYASLDGGPPLPLLQRAPTGGVLSLLGPASVPVQGSATFQLR